MDRTEKVAHGDDAESEDLPVNMHIGFFGLKNDMCLVEGEPSARFLNDAAQNMLERSFGMFCFLRVQERRGSAPFLHIHIRDSDDLPEYRKLGDVIQEDYT